MPNTTERGTGHVYLRGKIWWIKFYQEGAARYESSKSTSRRKAQSLLNQRLSEVQSGMYAPGEISVGQLLDEMLADHRIHNPRSYEKYALYLTDKRIRPFWGKYQAKRITTAKLLAFVERERKAGSSDGTINRELSLLHKALRLGTEGTPRKVAFIPKFPWLKENNVRKGFLEPAQYEHLKAFLPAELVPLLVVAYHTGCRRRELLSMQRDQVDLANRVMRLYAGTTKNEEPRTLPIYGEMIPVLEKQIAEIEANWPKCRFVFHRQGKPILYFRKSWMDACAKAGFAGLLFHDLRRSAVRNMVRSGVTEKVAMQISGHKTRSIFNRYDIIDERDLTNAAAKIGQYLSTEKNGEENGK